MDAHPRETSAMSFFFKHREPLGIKDRTCRQPTVAVDVKNPSIHPSIHPLSLIFNPENFFFDCTQNKKRRGKKKKGKRRRKRKSWMNEKEKKE
jgi:hypothetical protein